MMTAHFTCREAAPDELASSVLLALKRDGWRFGHQTARVTDQDHRAIDVLLLNTNDGGGEIITVPLPAGTHTYPSLAAHIPAAHWAERAISDFFGLDAEGHPEWKSLILHDDAWPDGLHPLLPGSKDAAGPTPQKDSPGNENNHHFNFKKIYGEGVHEVPVGPIHAGVIEPGHFRFSCLGEIVVNLEIRLGYQHRGIERSLQEIPPDRGHYLAESASSDTALGNALAHAVALENLRDTEVPPKARTLRTMALEIERVAQHLSDMSGLSADIGYSAGYSIFSVLKGGALGLCEMLTGSRFGRWYIVPGGVARDMGTAELSGFSQALAELSGKVEESLPLIMDNPSVIERMEGTGRLSASTAGRFGLVGPAARACGIAYDARQCFGHGLYPGQAPEIALQKGGDVLARALVRRDELLASLGLLARLASSMPDSPVLSASEGPIAPLRAGIGIVEAWRGELIHWITTDDKGAISRYAIKDPSFNNWTGLAVAIRGNLLSDFPLCNKSFNLSYSGNDL